VTSIPVLGNGDIWSGEDALAMIRATGCDGVVVGRGCLGRPWLFADLAAALAGRPDRARPTLAEVVAMLRRHLELLAEHFAQLDPEHAQDRACREIRKHIAWYFKGYPVGHDARARLALVGSIEEFDEIAATLDGDLPHPGEAAEGPRGRTGSARGVSLPEGWLDSRTLDDAELAALGAAELSVSGG
jgi:tRNA-dihydrouridine synthase